MNIQNFQVSNLLLLVSAKEYSEFSSSFKNIFILLLPFKTLKTTNWLLGEEKFWSYSKIGSRVTNAFFWIQQRLKPVAVLGTVGPGAENICEVRF